MKQSLQITLVVTVVMFFIATAYAIQETQVNATWNSLSRDLGNLFSLEK